jgi:hypothetical protein
MRLQLYLVMSWKDYKSMDERLKFIAKLLDDDRMLPLCEEFGISKKTGYNIYIYNDN